MREEEEEEEEKELNWFSRWEEELPKPEELMPLSQTLITPDLAVAFDIPTTKSNNNNQDNNISTTSTVKKPRLVWTPQLHKRFVEAVAHLGIKNAVPKTIMQLMNVDGLTRENVASHLQKYRLYLKRMQHSSSSASASSFLGADVASDRLFATTAPVVPIVNPAMQRQYRPMPMNQNRYCIQNHMGMMTLPMFRPPQPITLRPPPYVEELDTGTRMGRRVLSLFPDGED